MNLNPVDLNYTDGTNNYPLQDYIDDKINEIITGEIDITNIDSSNILINNEILSNILYVEKENNINHIYINNSNQYGEIRFTNLYTKSQPITHNVRINFFGKLEVYHYYNLLTTTVAEGWKDVEAEIAGLIFGLQSQGLEVIIVQGQIAAINANLGVLNTEIAEVEAEIGYLIAAISEDETLRENYDFARDTLNSSVIVKENGTRLIAIKTAEQTRQIFSQISSSVAIPLVIGGIGSAIYNIFLMKNLHDTYSNVNYSNNQNFSGDVGTSNYLYYEGQELINLRIGLRSLNNEEGFINSNIITSQFIPSLNTNEIKIGDITPNPNFKININGNILSSNYLNTQAGFALVNTCNSANSSAAVILQNDTSPAIINFNSSSATAYGGNNSLSILNGSSTGDIRIGNQLLTNQFYMSSNGIIGINTDTPNHFYKLDVNGNLNLSSGNDYYRNGVSLTSSLNTTSNNAFTNAYNYTNYTALNSINYNNLLNEPWINSGTNIYNANSGSVGINNTSPNSSYKLDVNGNLNLSSGNDYYRNGVSLTSSLNTTSNNAFTNAYNYTNYTALNSINYNNLLNEPWINSGTNIYNANSGNVGINNNSPNEKLNVNGVISIDNGNSTKLVFAYNSSLAYRHSISTNADANATNNNYIRFNLWNFGQASATLGNLNALTLATTYNQFHGNRYTYINDETANKNAYNHTTSPLSLYQRTATSTTALTQQPILHLSREGTSGQSYGARGTFTIGRWENNGTNSRTRLDLNISHLQYTDEVNVMSWRSDGRVGINNSAPTVALDVSGAIKASGAITGGAGSLTSLNLNSGGITNGGTINGTFSGNITGDLTGNADTATKAYRLNPYINEWHNSTDGYNRFYFGNNSHTYIKTRDEIKFRNKDDADIAQITYDGYILANFATVTSARDYIGIDEPNTNGANSGVKRIKVYFGSFTEYHRCFIEDPIFTNREEFLNEYEGRVVVSIGKIKQERRDGEGGEFPDWTILENKEAIRVDDAQPIIQLSRTRKDKRIYGVIGSKTTSYYSHDRIAINGVGEGGVWVVNTNGNIENGDLLQTSDQLGYAERADDDLIRNSTIGKSVMDCSFDLNSLYYKSKDLGNGIIASFIACVYMCS